MEASIPAAQSGRALNIAAWVAGGLLCALFLFAGIPKWLGLQQAVDGFQKVGFSDGFRIFIGTCETLGGIALLIPRLAFWSAFGLIIIMIGAIHTHVTHDDAANMGGAVIALALLLLIAYVRRRRALLLA